MPHPGRVLVMLSVAVTVAGSLMPAPVVGWLRVTVPLFALAWDKLDATFPGFNPLHIIFYAWLALTWRLLKPQWPRWRIPLILGVLGVLMEVGQLFVFEREARVSDALNDWVGIAIGLALAMLAMRLRQRQRVPRERACAR